MPISAHAIDARVRCAQALISIQSSQVTLHTETFSSLRHRHGNEPNMNLRRATVDDLMGMQNCNLHNLPEVRCSLVLSERTWH
jgi:hypothetical protein